MNNNTTLAVIKCAIQITLCYILKFLTPAIGIISHIGSKSNDNEMDRLINKMKKILNEHEIISKSTNDSKNNMDNEFISDNEDTNTIEYTDTNKNILLLKIKEIGDEDPDYNKFKLSDIYVNKKSKTFHIKGDDGFYVFPLSKKCIVRCDNNI